MSSVEDVLKEAASAVEKAGVPDDLRPAAFAAAVELLSGSNRGGERGGTAGVTRGSGREEASEGDLVGRIATKLDVAPEMVEAIFEQDGEELHLIVQRAKLPDSKRIAAAMRDVGLLVSAGRQAAGLEDWTTFKRLRDECEELKVLDTTNFSTEIKRLPARFQGPRNAQELKLTRHGLVEAKALIEKIVGGG